MKYISQDSRTRECLKHWSGDNELIVAEFFFYDLGSPIQKSIEGLLRTLLLQILRKHRELIPLIIPERWSNTLSDIDRETKEDVWSLSELRSAFRHLIQQKLLNMRLCLLIDGLDEYTGNPEEVVALVEELVASSVGQRVRIKACVSSRPYTAFEHGLRKHLQLKLQDLTKGDITRYVEDKLLEYKDQDFDAIHDGVITELISQVVEKAQGVFLWVRLVTGLLAGGLQDGDTINELKEKLEGLPPTLEGLYMRMLRKIRPEHRDQAAKLFSMMLQGGMVHTVMLSFAEAGPQSAINLPFVTLKDEDILGIHSRMVKRLTSRCVGLIEIAKSSYHVQISPALLDKQAVFLHKTVKDFLLEPQNLVDACLTTPSGFSPCINLLAGSLSCIKSIPGESLPKYDTITAAIGQAGSAEAWTAKIQVALLDELDRAVTMGINYSNDSGAPLPHWSSYHLDLERRKRNESLSCQDNFLSFAVEQRLFNYVKEKRNCSGPNKNGRPLLFYTLPDPRLLNYDLDPMCMQLVRLLLQDYGNINLKFQGQSVWQTLLKSIQNLRRDQPKYGPNGILKALLLFVDHGADPNATISLPYRMEQPTEKHHSSLKSRWFRFHRKRKDTPKNYTSQLTPLNIIVPQFGSSDDPRAVRLISQLRAKGGKESRKILEGPTEKFMPSTSDLGRSV